VRRPVDPAPPPRLAFRLARPDDVGRVMEIEKDGFQHPWSRALIERELGHPWSRVLLALAADPAGAEQVVGYVVFWLVHDEVHVLNVATALEVRRRGIGRALMEAAEEAGRARGARLSTLEVRRTNLGAIELYRAMGYRQVGVRPNYYAEEQEDALVMVKQLGGS
jgi:[ribosomal protein S18]-alanine N-acetyltransferase